MDTKTREILADIYWEAQMEKIEVGPRGDRQALVSAVENNDPNRPGAAQIVGKLLCGWHAVNGPYDVFVFIESFRAERLQLWQDKMLRTAPHSVCLGSRSGHSLVKIWAVSYLPESPFTREVIDLLKNVFV